MKKNIARSSVMAVAVLSLLVGGTSNTSNINNKNSDAGLAIGKAIEHTTIDVSTTSKGNLIRSFDGSDTEAQNVVTAAVEQAVEVQVKEPEIADNQVVANIDSYLNIRKEANEDSDVIGKFYSGNVGTLVSQGDEWSVVASGNAYGYVKNEYLLFGDDAKAYIKNNCDQVAKVNTETLNVRAETSTDSEIITLSGKGDTFTILGQQGSWVKVAVTDDQAGYVSQDYVYLDYVYGSAVTVEEEEAAKAKAEAEIAAQNADQNTTEASNSTSSTTNSVNSNNNSNTTKKSTESQTQAPATTQATTTEAPAPAVANQVTSTQATVTTQAPATMQTVTTQAPAPSAKGQAIANFACQFVGNPYVYGGTSLTNGADCSGFVQSVFANFGISLPRTAASQAGAGRAVSTSELQPGDLIFYHGYGHVAIYIGNGTVVHASTAATGIKYSNYNYSPIDKCVRVI